jgi:dolichol-phosphate mannosyltransferase
VIEIKTKWIPKVSVVLPSYNEKENIEEAIERITNAVGDYLQEIIIVDDNSPDGTWKLVEELNKPKVRLIRRIKEKGLASAIADGVAATKGNVVVWMDCDLGLPPEEIPRLVNRLDKYDVVIGSRYAKGGKDLRPAWRANLSTILNIYSSMVLGWKVRDYSSGFVAVSKPVTEVVKWKREGFGEYFVEFAYKCIKRGYNVTEVGYHFKDRVKGTSKSSGNFLTLLKYGFQYGFKVLKVKFKV